MLPGSLPHISTHKYEPPMMDGNALIYAQSAEKYHYPAHRTPYMLVTNFLNKGYYSLNSRPIEISDQFFYFLNANDELEIKFNQPHPLQTFFILFDDKFIRECIQAVTTSDDELLEPKDSIGSDPQIPAVPFSSTKLINHYISQLIQSNSQTPDDTVIFGLMKEFASVSSQTRKQLSRLHAIKRSTREELYRRLLMAKEFMIDNLSEKLTIEEIARHVSMNKYHFLEKFRELFHSTPYQYLHSVKMERAHQFLSTNNTSVSEVCFSLGFESISSFSNAFQRKFGTRPSALN